MNPLILIVDDSELVLQMLEMILAQANYPSVLATSLADVPDAIARQTPALILSDLNLPGLAGADPVSALRALDALATTPIILISGMDARQLRLKAQQLGADGAISKDAGMPAMMQALPALIDEILSKK